MYKVGKYLLIVFLFVSIASCSGSRRIAKEKERRPVSLGGDDLVGLTLRNNIGDKDFIISRFRLKYKDENVSKNASGFIKHSSDGKVLVSIRSLAGIEIARAYMDADSLKIYDRINSVLYMQSTDYMLGKFELDASLTDLLWGDLPEFSFGTESDSNDSDIRIYNLNRENTSFEFIVSGRDAKLKEVSVYGFNNDTTIINFSALQRFNDFFVPCLINIKNINRDIDIELEYSNIRFGKNKNMMFETGRVNEYRIIK
ncbi:MAG: DUF4292 domain-containing protein [Marinilabiliaceae bacterium]|jgi:hypothetical protein|nr:DUF4292 domain-containing protein [Marinilabiliaceae bacterium]